MGQNVKLYVGTYTNAESKGIYYHDFNVVTGFLTNKQLAAEVKNPSYLTLSSDKKYLYAVSEVADFDANKSGYVNAYEVTKNGLLKFINKVSTNGANPCYIETNSANNLAAIANYTGGNISIHKIKKNGKIKKAFQVINHSTHKEKAHPHFVKFINNHLLIADLGRNFLANYKKDFLNKGLYKLDKTYLIKNNAGPRHFVISKNEAFIYVMNELNSSITVLKKEANSYGSIQNISTRNKKYTGKNSGAEICLSKNGQFLYSSNRGENSIAVFKIDSNTGMLQKIQSIATYGNWPRNFTIAPNGNFLLVANKLSNNISLFKINKATGILTFFSSVESPNPTCLVFR
jgi:6-phosphogluconolactonase